MGGVSAGENISSKVCRQWPSFVSRPCIGWQVVGMSNDILSFQMESVRVRYVVDIEAEGKAAASE